MPTKNEYRTINLTPPSTLVLNCHWEKRWHDFWFSLSHGPRILNAHFAHKTKKNKVIVLQANNISSKSLNIIIWLHCIGSSIKINHQTSLELQMVSSVTLRLDSFNHSQNLILSDSSSFGVFVHSPYHAITGQTVQLYCNFSLPQGLALVTALLAPSGALVFIMGYFIPGEFSSDLYHTV